MQELHRQWGHALEDRMHLCGYRTHEAFAAALGVSQSSVTRWVRGVRGPSDRHKVAICRLLRCEVRVLFPLLLEAVA